MMNSKSSSPDQLKIVLNYLKYSGVIFIRELSLSDEVSGQETGTNITDTPLSVLTERRNYKP